MRFNLLYLPFYVIGTAVQLPAETKSTTWKGNGGLDLFYNLTPQLKANLTVNTDFAQVEEDLQQVNLTRFSLQFPEKRDFFLEGQGMFTFGGARPNNEASLRETLVRNELSIGDPAGPLLKGPVRRAIVPRRHRHRRPRNLSVKRGTVSPTQRLCRGAGKTDRSVRMARPPVCPASAGSLGGERNVRAKKMPAAVWARPASPESGKGSVAEGPAPAGPPVGPPSDRLKSARGCVRPTRGMYDSPRHGAREWSGFSGRGQRFFCGTLNPEP